MKDIYTFNKPAVDRIARTVRWVEDFQMDEGDNTVTSGMNPAYETPLGDPEVDEENLTITVVTNVELTSAGLVISTEDISTPYIERNNSSSNIINTTQCEG